MVQRPLSDTAGMFELAQEVLLPFVKRSCILLRPHELAHALVRSLQLLVRVLGEHSSGLCAMDLFPR
jgi:hypothetical protein